MSCANSQQSSVTYGRMRAFGTCLLLLLASGIGQAQMTTGDILGTITDPSGAVLPNVKMVLTNLGTQLTRSAQSDAAGQYVFTLLPAGQYSISASAAGFKNFVLPALTLNAGDRRRQDIQMAIGSASEQVEVSGTAPNLEADTSVLSTIVTERPVEDLPLNGRNFVQLAQLAAGANEGRPEAISNGNRPDDRRQTAAVSANAQSDTLNNELVDGLDNNSYTIGTIGVRPSIDAIAEFRVATNLYPAEIGKTPGAVVNLITKSGTNQLHGAAYEFVRNDMFDARNYFAKIGRTPEYRQNQFGASLGGPIRKDRTFFFGDYEGLRIVQGVTYTSTVPTLFEEQNPGNLSDIGGPVLMQNELSPIALKYFALYPAPNQPGLGNFVYSPNSTQFSHTFDVRVDQRFSEQDNLFGRYTFNDVTTFTPGGLPPVNGIQPAGSASFPGDAKQRAQQLLLKAVHTFSATLLLELSAGYSRINNASFPLNYGSDLGNQFGIQNANFNQFSSGLPTVSIAGYTGFGGTSFLPLIDLDNVYQFSGAVTRVRDQHTFKFGSVIVRRDIYNQQSPAGAGTFSFSTTPSPFALANFLSGTVFQVTRQLQLYPRYLSDWEPSFYAQDDWRVRRWLTLNLGLRYDIITPVSEKYGHISHFDPGCACMVVADQNGASSTANIETEHRSIAPRFGFAASIGHDTVLRGGYGLVFFRDNTGPSVPFADPPFTTAYAPAQLSVPFDAPLPIPTSQSLTNLSGGLRGMQLTYRNSYVEQINFNMEHAFGGTVWMIGYVGSLGRHLRITPDVNLAPPSPLSVANRRPFYSLYPNVTSIFEIMSEGYNNYHGLQTSLERRLSHGFMATANYTWSHAIGDTQGFSAGGLYTSAVPSQTATLERGNSELDMRHRFTLMLVYEVPFGAHLHGWRGALAKGWQFNAIDVWETGFPFSVVNASPKSNTGVGSDRPNQLGNAHLDHPSISRWFDTSMFQAQTMGTIGSESRNALYGPHFRHFDLSVFKDFHVTERAVLQARAESFNLTNTPNFSLPAASLGAMGFGTITSTRVGSTPRQLQLALRLAF